MPDDKLLKVRLSVRGRSLRTYRFGQDVVRVGRGEDADVVLDHPDVAGEHIRLERTPGGFFAVERLVDDDEVTLNHRAFQREFLMNNDVVRIGRFALWVSYEEPLRAVPGGRIVRAEARGSAALSPALLREADAAAEAWEEPQLGLIEGRPAPDPAADPLDRQVGAVPLGPLLAAIFFLGLLVGAVTLWLVLRAA